MTGRDKSGSYKPTPTPTSCQDFVDKTSLTSPKAPVKQLKVGDRLRVELQPIKAGGNTVIAITEKKETAGAITSTKTPRLIKCLEEGHKYIAVVLSISGGQCTIEIKSASATP